MQPFDNWLGLGNGLRMIARHLEAWRTAWRGEGQGKPELIPQGKEVEFLPAVLEIQHAPPSPIGRAILWTIMALFAAGAIWASLGKIDIVAVAHGRIVPSTYTKTVQPLESGVVTAIHVKDGQHVSQGDLLVELDPTISSADRERIQNDYAVARVDIARLTALLQGAEKLEVPTGVDPAYATLQQSLLRDQSREIKARIEAAERIVEQRQAAIKAIEADILRLEQIVPIMVRRAESFHILYAEGHGSLLEAEEATREKVQGVQELVASRERLTLEGSALLEARQNLEAIAAEFRKNLQTQLAEIETRAQRLSKDLVKATHADQRQHLAAPVDGIVQQLSIHTIGGVVTPAQPLLVIVPDEGRLEVEAWIENKDIGFVDTGQIAGIKVDAFPFTRYGIIDGEIVTLSKDAIPIDKVGYVYAARVSMARTEMQVGNGRTVHLAPGMDVAVEVRTGERRLIEFLLSPVLKASLESARER